MRTKLASMLRSGLRETSAVALRTTGVPSLVRRVATRQRATILMYHDPRPEVLDRHLAYLRERFHFITLDRLVTALHDKDWSRMPPRSLVVTIDDGHRGNRLLGDVFRKYGCRPTIYLCTAIVGTHRRFWFNAGSFGHLKALPHDERLRRLQAEAGFVPTREYDGGEPEALTVEDIEAMREWADIESHSRFHPVLTTCADDECEREIRDSKTETEALSGTACRHFSFPNGDFTEREIEMVKRAGYRSARSTDFGWNGPGTDPYHLRVAGATDDASVSMLAVQLSCMVSYARCALQGNFDGTTRKNVLR